MGNLKIDAGKVASAKSSAKALEQSLEITHQKCQSLISYVQGAKWRGKSRDAFLSYLEIIEQYHEKVKKEIEKQSKALKNLETYIDDFEESKISQEVKRL